MREEHESQLYKPVTYHQGLNYSENSSKGRLNPASREHPRRRQINGCTIKDLFVYKLEEIKTIFRASGPAQSGRKLRPIDRAVPHSRQVSLPRSAAASQLTRMLISFITRVGELAEASGDSTARPVGDSLTGSLRQAASRSGPIRGS